MNKLAFSNSFDFKNLTSVESGTNTSLTSSLNFSTFLKKKFLN